MENWTLQDAKVGDRVLIYNRFTTTLATIDRITTRFVICGKDKYRKSNGSSLSQDPWSSKRARLANDDEIKAFKAKAYHNSLSKKCSVVNFSKLSTEQLERILAITKEGEN